MIKELFPAPVRPTIPICSPGLIINEILSNAGDKPFLYFNSTLQNSNSPSIGH